jgi:hypothetical protein
MQHQGRREFFVLGTPNKEAAAARARDIYVSLVARGWEATLTRYRRGGAEARLERRIEPCTVGEFLDALFRTASNHQTIESYAKRFRQIVPEMFNLSEGEQKYDYHRGGLGKWLAKVHGVKLAEVTPARAEEWKWSFLAKASILSIELRGF